MNLIPHGKRLLAGRFSLLAQQVRFKKTIKYRRIGEWPLLSQDDWRQAEEGDKFDELSFKPVKFALLHMSNSPLIDNQYEKFVNYVMEDGRKALAYDLMHDTFYHIKQIQYKRWKKDKETVTDPMEIFKKAVVNCQPVVITKPIRRGGAIYQVPHPLAANDMEFKSMKWIISAVLDRPKPRLKRFKEVMANELIDAFYGRGKVIKKRDDMHKAADANKAYAHYRWG